MFNEFWPQGHLDYADLWKGNTVPQLPAKSWRKITQQQLEDILLYAPGKGEYRMPSSHFMDLLYSEGDMSTATSQQWLLYERRNQAAEMRKQITMNSAKPLAVLTVTKSLIYLSHNAMECYNNMSTICN